MQLRQYELIPLVARLIDQCESNPRIDVAHHCLLDMAKSQALRVARGTNDQELEEEQFQIYDLAAAVADANWHRRHGFEPYTSWPSKEL